MNTSEVSGRRILVVEDDPTVRDSIALLLRIDRHKVTQAANGQEALDLVSRQTFDLVVLDFAMPGMFFSFREATEFKSPSISSSVILVCQFSW